MVFMYEKNVFFLINNFLKYWGNNCENINSKAIIKGNIKENTIIDLQTFVYVLEIFRYVLKFFILYGP